MAEFILQIVLMLSLVVMVVLVARAVPRVNDDEGSRKLEDWLRNIPIDKVDDYLKKFYYKFLRKLRVFLLKADNIVRKRLEDNFSRLPPAPFSLSTIRAPASLPLKTLF